MVAIVKDFNSKNNFLQNQINSFGRNSDKRCIKTK